MQIKQNGKCRTFQSHTCRFDLFSIIAYQRYKIFYLLLGKIHFTDLIQNILCVDFRDALEQLFLFCFRLGIMYNNLQADHRPAYSIFKRGCTLFAGIIDFIIPMAGFVYDTFFLIMPPCFPEENASFSEQRHFLQLSAAGFFLLHSGLFLFFFL